MATTTGGTTYVTSTDLVADYPTASLALANRVDVVASGSMSKKTALHRDRGRHSGRHDYRHELGFSDRYHVALDQPGKRHDA